MKTWGRVLRGNAETPRTRSGVGGRGTLRATLHGLAAGACGLHLLTVSAGAGPRPSLPAAGPSLVERVAVFGADDRQPVPSKYQATAQSIGVLFNNQTRTVCTAFCVGDAIIATAAHCLS